MQTKRIIALLLAAMMSASALIACSDSPSGDSTDTSAPDSTADTTTVEETTADPLADDLPNDVKYDNYTFRIGASSKDMEFINYVVRFEQTGETLNDAIYDANKAVSERFGIQFSHVGIAESNYNASKLVTTSIQAGEDLYDVISLHDNRSAGLMLEGLLRNVYDLEHIDVTKPWWPEFTVNSLTVNGKMYQIANAMTYYGLYSTRCLFFNKGLMTDMGIKMPYDDVRAGTWYLDDLINMTKDIYSDLDNDGKRSIGDRYGFALTGGAFCYMECFGAESLSLGKSGKLEESFINERNIGAVQKSNNWFFGGSPGVYYSNKHAGYFKEDSALTMFGNGNVLFGFNSVGRQTQACMDSDVEFGIVPMPKLDENQEDYISGAVDNPICIPVTNLNMDRTGMIVEAMGAGGYRRVQPAYTESVMKARYATDKDSVEMLDIIFGNRMLSGGYLYFGENQGRFIMTHEYMWKEGNSNANVVSFLETNKNLAQERIDALNKFFFEEK